MGLLSKNVKNKNTCLLVNCPWLLVFAQYLFFLFLSAFNLYFWSNKHFSWSLDLVFLFNFFFAVVGLHLYFTDLIRESYKQYEIYIIRSAYSHFSLYYYNIRYSSFVYNFVLLVK